MRRLLKTKRNQIGTTLRYAIAEFSLGLVAVAASGKGLCAVLLGDDQEALIQALRDRFPDDDLVVAADRDFKRMVDLVISYIEAPNQRLELPLDIQGTPFQKRVWQALRKVPVGSTTSYSEIATRIGSPKAARAVARACATNAIALAIPCHRIMCADGTISGYRWGIERKRALLEREKMLR